MTDKELNQLVAERVLGHTVAHDSWGNQCLVLVEDNDSEHWPALPDYCTEPAAWGFLFTYLLTQKRKPSIWQEAQDLVGAMVGTVSNFNNAVMEESYNADVGRALVLATLAAYGVKV